MIDPVWPIPREWARTYCSHVGRYRPRGIGSGPDCRTRARCSFRRPEWSNGGADEEVSGDLYSFEIWWDLDDWTGNVWVFTHQQDGDVNYTDLTAIDCEGLDPTS